MSSEIQRSMAAAQQEHRLPAEMRVEPTLEPTVEVDVEAHLPPEAAVIAVTHRAAASEGTPAAASSKSRRDSANEDVVAAEAAAEQAHPLPAEMRVPPTVAPAVEVDDGTYLPPEAAATPVTHKEGEGIPR